MEPVEKRKLLELQGRMVKNQEILIRQNLALYRFLLYSEYGWELEEIEKSSPLEIPGRPDNYRRREAARAAIEQILQIRRAWDVISDEEKANFLKEASSLMKRPAMQKAWQKIKAYFPEDERNFIDFLARPPIRAE